MPWQEAPDRLYQVTRQPDYAGWYLDSDRERLPVLMWAGDLDAAGALLIEVLGEDATFEVRPAERTWKELKGIADQVSDMRSRFDERGILLVETEYDVKRNRIDVGIKATKKKQAVAERMLAELDDAVRVRRVDVPQFDS